MTGRFPASWPVSLPPTLGQRYGSTIDPSSSTSALADRTWSHVPGLRDHAGVALVDFDNWRQATPSAPIEQVVEACLAEVQVRLMNAAPHLEFMLVRLYGGWVESGGLTDKASEVAAVAARPERFPFQHQTSRIIHGEIQLANHLLLAPRLNLGDTFRRRGSPTRLRLSGSPVPDGCVEHQTQCPAKILQRFTRSAERMCPTDSCPVTASRAFMTWEQKMVDTLLACDLIAVSTDPRVEAIAVVTADSDLFPPLIQASLTNRSRILLLSNLPFWNTEQITSLSGLGITYHGPEVKE